MNHFFCILKTGLFALLWLTVASPSVFAQDQSALPNNFDELIDLKTQTLEQYSELVDQGSSEDAIQVLRKIVNIHRKAYQIARNDGANDEILQQLRDVFANDAEFYSDELFSRRQYTESSAIRKEMEQLLSEHYGASHELAKTMHWKAITSEKLSDATRERQVTYTMAMASEDQAIEALQNGDYAVAVQIYRQLITAQIAVLGENHPDVGTNLNDLGRALVSQGKHSDAEAIYERSMKIHETTTGHGLPYATALYNLGRSYHDTERYAEAEEKYLATAAIEEPILGSTNDSFLLTLNQLAMLYREVGNEEKLAAIEKRITSADPFASVVAHLPTHTFAAAAIQPNGLLVDPEMELAPFEVMKVLGDLQLGFDPIDAEAAVAFMTLPIAQPPFNFGVLFRLKEDATPDFVWLPEMVSVSLNDGQQYMKEDSSEESPLCFAEFDDGVFLLGTEETIRQALTGTGGSLVEQMLLEDVNQGELIAAVNLEPIRTIIQMAIATAPEVPREMEGLKSVVVDADTIQLSLNASKEYQLSLVLSSSDQPHAERISTALSDALLFAKDSIMNGVNADLTGDDPLATVTRSYFERLAVHYLDELQPVVSENSVSIDFNYLNQSIGPMIMAMLFPVVEEVHLDVYEDDFREE